MGHQVVPEIHAATLVGFLALDAAAEFLEVLGFLLGKLRVQIVFHGTTDVVFFDDSPFRHSQTTLYF